jgi:hypothetical protein
MNQSELSSMEPAQRKDPNRDRELGGMSDVEDTFQGGYSWFQFQSIPNITAWVPLAFEYPEVIPCLHPIRDVKPVPYRPFKWGEYQ